MGKHSPGPWEPWLPGRKFVKQKRNFKAICELEDHDRSRDEVVGNAYLIAAAPDLLAACKLTLERQRMETGMGGVPTDHGYCLHKDAVLALQAAIALAEGAS